MAQGVKRTRNPFSVFHNSFCCHVPSLQNYEAKYEEKYKQKKNGLQITLETAKIGMNLLVKACKA